MALQAPKINPKKRYVHKVSYEGPAKGNRELHQGELGLRSKQGNWLTAQQIEAGRKVLAGAVKKVARIIIRVFAHYPKTKHPLESRMGSGKGSVDKWVAVVKKGTIIYEIKMSQPKYEPEVREALRLAAYKLPVRCEIVSKVKVDEKAPPTSSKNPLPPAA